MRRTHVRRHARSFRQEWRINFALQRPFDQHDCEGNAKKMLSREESKT